MLLLGGLRIHGRGLQGPWAGVRRRKRRERGKGALLRDRGARTGKLLLCHRRDR